jgi:Zn-dependent protease
VTRGIRFGRIGGVEIVADLSVLFIAAALSWVLYLDIAAGQSHTDPTVAAIIAILSGVLFFGSVLVHEASHAVVARRRGMHVRRIRLLAFGGYTTIEGSSERPSDEFIVAVAGPLVSFALAGMLWLMALAVETVPAAASSIRFLAFVNLFIGAFNLLPGFPLDGGRALRSAIWRFGGDRVRATETAVKAGRVLGWVVIAVATVNALVSFQPMALLWIVLGWYLLRSAEGAGRRERLLARAGGLVAGDVMRRTPDPVPGDMLVSRVIELFQIGSRLRSLPVEVDGRIRGVIGEQEVADLSPARRIMARASSAMTEIGPGDVITVETPLDAMMGGSPGRSGRLVVVDEGRVVGVIDGADLTAAIGDAGS